MRVKHVHQHRFSSAWGEKNTFQVILGCSDVQRCITVKHRHIESLPNKRWSKFCVSMHLYWLLYKSRGRIKMYKTHQRHRERSIHEGEVASNYPARQLWQLWITNKQTKAPPPWMNTKCSQIHDGFLVSIKMLWLIWTHFLGHSSAACSSDSTLLCISRGLVYQSIHNVAWKYLCETNQN